MTPEQDYLHVIQHTQLISLDLLIVNEYNQVLLGFRENEPARHTWFTFGSRLFKEESLPQVCERVSTNEVGFSVPFGQCQQVGIYKHTYTNNFANNDFGTVYIVFAYMYRCKNDDIRIDGDNQHSQYQWFDIATIHNEPTVHPYVKEYFKKNPLNRFQ